MNTTSHCRPSKRPKVSQVHEWRTVHVEDMDNDWRGLYGGTVIVQVGYPFPDFYRVITHLGKPPVKKSKLFYGESAYHNVVRYVSDFGFPKIHNSNF
jgi:hypothetical protein